MLSKVFELIFKSIKMGERNQTLEWKWEHDDQDNEYNKKKKKMMIGEFETVNISEDLMMEIILHLPPLSVLKFKCVCKRWYALISNPDFLRTHASLQYQKHTNWLVHSSHLPPDFLDRHFDIICPPQDKNQTILLKPQFLKQIHDPPLSVLLPQNHSRCYLEDACNGLLLLLCHTEDDDNSCHSYKTYYIFNLITEHYFKLPNTDPIPNINEKEFEITTNIVFEPSASLSYKVIRVFKNESGIRFDVHGQLYSSETKSWRLLNTSIVNDVDFDFGSRPTLLDGVLYWSYWSTPLDVSYCFDVEKESISPLPLPPRPDGWPFRLCLYFGECGGRLRLIEKYLDSIIDIDPDPLTLPSNIVVMELEQQRQNGCSPWIRKYLVNIGYPPFVRDRVLEFEFIHYYKVGNKSGGEEEAMLLNINGGFLVSYNLTSNTFGKVLRLPMNWSRPDFRKFFPFTPTLFPLC